MWLVAACEPSPEASRPGEIPLRIVTLAPHLAELVYAAGAGEGLVGVSAWSDYPPGVAGLPVIGDAFAVDQERLRLLEPDLILVWESGTPAHVAGELRELGYRVETIRTRGLHDVAKALLEIGGLTGHHETAERAAERFVAGLDVLGASGHAAPPLRVFYQVSARPLYTVNGSHYISELIELCGGRNIFAGLGMLAPAVSAEAVIERDPEVMLAAADADPLDVWDRWPDIAAVRYGNRFLVEGGEIGRATPRLLDAGEKLCALLNEARARARQEDEHG